MIKLRFSTNNNIVHAGIRFATKSKVSHVDVVVNKVGKGILNAWGYEYFSSYPVIKTGLHNNKYDKSYYGETYLTDVKEKMFWNFLKNQIGKPYDWYGIVGYYFHRDWQQQKMWFCSELIAAAFLYVDHPIIHRDSKYVSPGNIMDSTMVKYVKQ